MFDTFSLEKGGGAAGITDRVGEARQYSIQGGLVVAGTGVWPSHCPPVTHDSMLMYKTERGRAADAPKNWYMTTIASSTELAFVMTRTTCYEENIISPSLGLEGRIVHTVLPVFWSYETVTESVGMKKQLHDG